MKKLLTTAAFAALATGSFAGGLDRSGQSVGLIFEEGNKVQLSYGSISPSVSGVGLSTVSTGSVANKYSQVSGGIKYDISSELSFALMADSPFGADVSYDAASPEYAGTFAKVKSQAVTGILRYKVSDRASVYGGLRYQTASGSIRLAGGAHGGIDYTLQLDSDAGLGYVVGASYEVPDIALRVSLTYNSKVKHDLAASQTGLGGGALTAAGTVTVETPESLNLEFQSGIAQNTLLFGSIRYAKWGDFDVVSPILGDLADLSDSTSYNIGVGRKLNDTWAVSASFGYEASGGGEVSPLAPSDGSKSIALAAVYTMDEVKVTTGVRYVKLGDATTTNGAANFTDNDVLAVGVSVTFGF